MARFSFFSLYRTVLYTVVMSVVHILDGGLVQLHMLMIQGKQYMELIAQGITIHFFLLQIGN